jgi:hypothetical protein
MHNAQAAFYDTSAWSADGETAKLRDKASRYLARLWPSDKAPAILGRRVAKEEAAKKAMAATKQEFDSALATPIQTLQAKLKGMNAQLKPVQADYLDKRAGLAALETELQQGLSALGEARKAIKAALH